MRARSAVVLGLDPGTHTGWAVAAGPDRILASGVESFADVADLGYGAMFSRFRHFMRQLHAQHGSRTRGFAAVAYELPFLRGPISSRILWGMAAHAQELAWTWRARVLPVNTMTLKKFATGSGKATKAEMIASAEAALPDRYDLGTFTEHEADAIHVARWAAAQLAGGEGHGVGDLEAN